MGKDDEDSVSFTNLRQLASQARGQVDPAAYDYIAGGSGEEATLANNDRGWERYQLRHRVLRDVSKRRTATRLLGSEVAFPALVAPTAFHKLAHPRGEVATAEGAAAAGTIMVASTLATVRLEDVAEAAEGPRWFQLYVYEDRKLTEQLVARAEAAGYEAIVVTVDSPVWGRRERDVRNGFQLPEGLGLANFPDLDQEALPDTEGDSLAAYVEQQLDPSLEWSALAWLTSTTELPVLVKGVVHPEDARLAVEHGAAGVIVSNHGGRQLDAGVSTARALPAIVEAVQGRASVLVDGGIRRGTHVVTALALGAEAVLVGRPILWALAVDGARGVQRALELLHAEIDNAMALIGAADVEELAPGMVLGPEPA